MTDWSSLSRRAAFVSHRLIGWIYWDPVGIANYTALGVPDGAGYYIATRGATLASAGNGPVTAAFGSIHSGFVAASLDLCRDHTTFESAAAARDAAVVEGLRTQVPAICEPLGELAAPLWDAADSLPVGGRVFFASLREWPRPSDPLLSAWLAVNCIREWRGDTHWAIEDRLDDLAAEAWRALGEDRTSQFLDLVEPVGHVLLARIDETAGPNWMPAARDPKPVTR
jgi:hypothetical protein